MNLSERMKNLRFYVVLFFGVIIAFILLLGLSFLIPNSAIESNRQQGLAVIAKEGDYPLYLFDSPGAQMDNYTDRLMLEATEKPAGENYLYAALNVHGYAWYWHGYLAFLRLALVFFNYYQIRYFCMILFLALLSITFSLLRQKAGIRIAIYYLLAIGACYAVIVSVLMQYMSVFVIMFVGCIWLLKNFDSILSRKLLAFFLILGMGTNYLDLLTAPLLTLGMPLLIALFLEMSQCPNNNFLINLKKIFFPSMFWGIGYGGCWITKWTVGSLLLRRNIIADAVNQAIFRVSGDKAYPLNRKAALTMSFNDMFFYSGILWIFIIILIIWVVLAIVFRVPVYQWRNTAILLIVSAYPYVWFMVMANHTQIHHWFVYRIQAITIFGILCCMDMTVNWVKVHKWMSELRCKCLHI